jgi:signal transduction histidine kinase
MPVNWRGLVQRILAWRPRLRLRYLFLATFTLVAVLPAAALTGWVSMQALTREKASTGAKQQHLAQVIALGLDRYARDVCATFEHMASLDFGARDGQAVFRLAQNLRFRYIALISNGSTIQEFTDFEYGQPGRLTPETIAFINKHASQSPDILPIIRDGSGEPTIFVVEAYPDGSTLAAALSIEHIQATQKAIGFGIHGHGVIVDQTGQIIAHPNADWEKSGKSLASLAPVRALQALPAGSAGFIEFQPTTADSSAMAGFARAEDAGWGVMTVRPMVEIEAVAWDFAFGSIVFVAIGLLVALILALAMARVIVRPVERVASVAQSLSRGDLTAQVQPVPNVPTELGDLSRTINRLARNLNLWRLNLTESLEEAQASDQAKTNFLASMSHEIRTPLTAIIGFAEALRDQTVGPKFAARQREYSADIITASEHLVLLIDGILDLSNAAHTAGSAVIGPVCLKDSCEAILKLLQAQAEREQIKLTYHLPQGLPAIAGHEGKLKQALLNLTSNAIKFTPSGRSVNISAEVHANGTVSVAITDTGIGMSSRDLDIALTPCPAIGGGNGRYICHRQCAR